MTNEMQYLMHLYACAATSTPASPPTYHVDFEALYALADKMSLLSMLSYALKISPDTGCPDDIKSQLYTVMLGTSLKNKMRMESLLTLLEDIEKQGIKAVVVKGLDCARFYAKPECRISADTDLFVNKKDEETLLDFFEQNGFTVRRRKKKEHHSECISKKTGMIEVHTKIWEDDIYGVMPRNVMFSNRSVDASVEVSVGGKSIRVLAPTEAMKFMTLHFVKHFIFGCAGLKMVYDLALYFVHNKALINTEAYTDWLQKAGYETVVSALFSAMVLYCGFAKEDVADIARFDEKLAEILANALEQYDSGNADRLLDPAMMMTYCTAHSNAKKNGSAYAFLFNAKNVIVEKFGLLFPKLSHLKKTYLYLEKHPYLYLAACIHRFFARGTKHVFHGDPKNGKVFGYRENLDSILSEHEESQIQNLKEMGLL